MPSRSGADPKVPVKISHAAYKASKENGTWTTDASNVRSFQRRMEGLERLVPKFSDLQVFLANESNTLSGLSEHDNW